MEEGEKKGTPYNTYYYLLFKFKFSQHESPLNTRQSFLCHLSFNSYHS